MHYTYRCDSDCVVVVEFVEIIQSAYHLCGQVYVRLSAVAEMQQANKGKHKLHHTAASSLSLSQQRLFVVLRVSSDVCQYLPILLYTDIR